MTAKPDYLQTDLETILIAEDGILIRTAISDYLRTCGYRVIEAATADEAIVMLNEQKIRIDIVLASIQMPGSMNGFELARWIRENKRDIDVVLAGTDNDAADKASDLCNELSHVKKPYEPDQLLDFIKRLRAIQQSHPLPKRPSGF